MLRVSANLSAFTIIIKFQKYLCQSVFMILTSIWMDLFLLKQLRFSQKKSPLQMFNRVLNTSLVVSSHASGTSQLVLLRTSYEGFFFFQTSTVPFPSFFEYHVIFQDQSKGEYDIIGMTELILLQFISLQYVVYKELHHRKYCQNCFLPSLQIFVYKNTMASFGKHERII